VYIPEQGDIVAFSFDPSSGKEIIKRRPAIVLSRSIFNERTGFAVVAPITRTLRSNALEVVLPAGLETTGAVMVYQLKSLDYHEREAAFIEKVPAGVIQKVQSIARAILS